MSEKTPEEQAAIEAAKARYVGNYLEAADLMGRGMVALTIAEVVDPNEVRDRNGEGRLIDKYIVKFQGTRKALILNVTNYKAIQLEHGSDPAKWVGKKIVVACRYLREYKGEKNVPVVRVIVPAHIQIPLAMRGRTGRAEPWPSDGKN